MHLLNTTSMQLEYHGKPPEKYAILSHTWGDEEILYADIKSEDRGRSKKGFKKVENCCKLARSQGYDLVWIDTCCIDKSSSAELSEAINSMFDWYQGSDICYALLEDFSPKVNGALVAERVYNDWKYCKYFTRGWTLQELLASYPLHFYDRNWEYFKSKKGIADELATKLGIAPEVLKDIYNPYENKYSIATRMSWASKRETSRPEDIAYCLLGIFGVNMPLLYGEGGIKAFFRLQEEIIRNSNDESIFAWAEPGFFDGPTHMFIENASVLAESPASFVGASNIVPSQRDNEPYSMTNMGLSICLPVLQFKFLPSFFAGKVTTLGAPPEYAVLNCHYYDDFRGPLCIELQSSGSDFNRFYRTPRKLFLIESSLAAKAEKRSIFISRFGTYSGGSHWFGGHNSYSYFWVRTKMVRKYLKNQPVSVQGFPSEFWNCNSAVLSKPISELPNGAALVTIGAESDQLLRFAVLFEADLWKYSSRVVLLLHSEFDESRYSIIEYAYHLTTESGDMSSLKLSRDVQVVAKIKKEVIMGKAVNVVELCVNYLGENFVDKVTS